MRQYGRQGDLLFVETEETDIQQEVKNGVLAEGEATGHQHYIVPEDLNKCKVGWSDGPGQGGPRRLVIQTIEEIRVRHPDHNKQDIVLPRGKIIQVIRQEENIGGIIRRVQD